jgi:hypothetical protein
MKLSREAWRAAARGWHRESERFRQRAIRRRQAEQTELQQSFQIVATDTRLCEANCLADASDTKGAQRVLDLVRRWTYHREFEDQVRDIASIIRSAASPCVTQTRE